MSAAIRQTWQVNLRYVRFLARQPAFLGITLTQPIIWLLLFGALFKAVTQIPGFHGDSYVDFLTPGIVVMLAVSSAGWTGMGFIEDINAGIMDRLLVSPVCSAPTTSTASGASSSSSSWRRCSARPSPRSPTASGCWPASERRSSGRSASSCFR
jgi:ABC-2 type transport system permease protein